MYPTHTHPSYYLPTPISPKTHTRRFSVWQATGSGATCSGVPISAGTFSTACSSVVDDDETTYGFAISSGGACANFETFADCQVCDHIISLAIYEVVENCFRFFVLHLFSFLNKSVKLAYISFISHSPTHHPLLFELRTDTLHTAHILTQTCADT